MELRNPNSPCGPRAMTILKYADLEDEDSMTFREELEEVEFSI